MLITKKFFIPQGNTAKRPARDKAIVEEVRTQVTTPSSTAAAESAGAVKPYKTEHELETHRLPRAIVEPHIAPAFSYTRALSNSGTLQFFLKTQYLPRQQNPLPLLKVVVAPTRAWSLFRALLLESRNSATLKDAGSFVFTFTMPISNFDQTSASVLLKTIASSSSCQMSSSVTYRQINCPYGGQSLYVNRCTLACWRAV